MKPFIMSAFDVSGKDDNVKKILCYPHSSSVRRANLRINTIYRGRQKRGKVARISFLLFPQHLWLERSSISLANCGTDVFIEIERLNSICNQTQLESLYMGMIM